MQGWGDRCARWKINSSPHSRPCDFRCPTSQESSPASFASGFSGSTLRSKTGTTNSYKPEGVHLTTGHLNAKLSPKRFKPTCFNCSCWPAPWVPWVMGKKKRHLWESGPKKELYLEEWVGPGRWSTYFLEIIFFNFGGWGEIFRMCLKINCSLILCSVILNLPGLVKGRSVLSDSELFLGW